MQAPVFSHLEHHLPARLGLSLEEIRERRNKGLTKGVDWDRIGRWIKFSDAGVEKLGGQVGVAEIKPVPQAEWKGAVVTRCHFPNKHLIEVKEDGGALRLVRIPVAWHDLYKQKMPIKILVGAEPVATTRRPKGRYQF